MGERKEYRGEFWLASHPSHRVAGTLTFHPKRQGELRLNQSLEPGLAHDRQEWDRIMGDVLGGSCVLYHCFWLGSRSSEESPGDWVEQPRIFVNALMTMPRTDSASPPERFAGLTATFRGLPEFDGRQAFGSEHDRDEDVERVTARRLDPLTVSTAQATYTIRQGTGSRSSNFKAWSVTSTHWLVVEPHEPATLDELLDRFSTFRTFLALAMHQDCRMKGPITLLPSRGPEEPGDDGSVRSYQYHAAWRRGTKHSYDYYNRVVSWDSMGAEGVARWLDLEEECGHVIDRLSSMRFVKHLAFEDALVRIMAAADSLHRVVTRTPKTGAETMLKDLARYVGPPFTNAVPDLDTWAKTVVDERHNAAHNKGNPVTVDLKLTTELVMSVYWLVFLGLLRRADVPDSAMQEAVGSQPFVWPMKRVREGFQRAD